MKTTLKKKVEGFKESTKHVLMFKYKKKNPIHLLKVDLLSFREMYIKKKLFRK